MDTVSIILDVIWFILAYDIFRSLAEAIVSDFSKKGGIRWERKVSCFDIPIACFGIAFCVIAMHREPSNSNIHHALLYFILVIAVSVYRSFIRHHITHRSGL